MTTAQRLELKGIEKGRKEGIEKGIEKKALETARMMFLAGEPIDKIIRYTGLSEDRIKELT